MTKRHRSFSQFKTMSKCGEQYRLQRTLDLPRSPSAAMALGSSFHANYEQWELEGRSYDLASYFTNHYEEEIARCWVEQPNKNYWGKTARVKEVETDIAIRHENGLLMSEAYDEHCRESVWKVYEFPGSGSDGGLGLEFKFEIDLGDFTFRGAIDSLLVWPSGNTTIRDLKTGIREVSGFQLGVYSYALRKAGLEVKHGEFYYTKDGRSEAYDLKRYTDAYVEDQLVKLDAMIMAEEYLVTPGITADSVESKITVERWVSFMSKLSKSMSLRNKQITHLNRAAKYAESFDQMIKLSQEYGRAADGAQWDKEVQDAEDAKLVDDAAAV